MVVLGFVKLRKQLQRRLLLHLRPVLKMGGAAGPLVVVIQPHQVGVDGPQPCDCIGDVLLIGEGDVQIVIGRRPFVEGSEGDLLIAAAELPEVVLRQKGDGANGDASLFPQLGDRD